jgi:alpha-N-arabinofuranosidase
MHPKKSFLYPVSRRNFLASSARAGAGMLAASLLSGSRSLRAAQATAAKEEPLRAAITVDADMVSHRVNPNIYGTFTEHIGRCIYGGVYEEGSPLSDEDGFRKDVLAAARDWGVPNLRWPGGDFASNYHWEDGIGPKASRPRKYNAAWYEEESNHFGTDEFISYCRKVGTEPYICVNVGSGTLEEAANWVEYCNGTGDTHYANLRRKYGHAQPYNVRYWGLGNEVYGIWQIGHKNAEDYAKFALESGKWMKWVDPTIKLVACGADNADWNRTVLEKLVNVADYISLHDYEGTDNYYDLLGTLQRFEKRIRLTDAAIELTDPARGKDLILAESLPEVRTKKRMEIAVDEWNVWYRRRDIWRRDIPNPVEEKYNLRDALWVASVLNLFQRMGQTVTLANQSQMVNVLGAIFTSKEGLFLQTIYFPMKLYCRECGPLYLASRVSSPTFSSKTCKDMPFLDVSATQDEDKKQIALVVVNRHESKPVAADLDIRGAKIANAATLFEINGASPGTENSFTQPNNVKIEKSEFRNAGSRFTYTFPGHSVTLLKLRSA